MPSLTSTDDDDPLVRLSLDRKKRPAYWTIHSALLERDSSKQMDAIQIEATLLERLKDPAIDGDRLEKADVFEASFAVRRLAATAGLAPTEFVEHVLAGRPMCRAARFPEFDPFGLRSLLIYRSMSDDSLPWSEVDELLMSGARGDAPEVQRIVARWTAEHAPATQRALTAALREAIDRLDEHSPAFEPLVRLHFRWMVTMLQQVGVEIAHAHCRLLQKVRGARDGFLVRFVDRTELGRMVQRHWAAGQSELMDYYQRAMNHDHAQWVRDFECEILEPVAEEKQPVTFVAPTRASRFPFFARIVGLKL